MTLAYAINRIRNTHQDCCLTDSYDENNCGLNLTGLDSASLTTIHGSQYQAQRDRRHPIGGRLCDRVIFGRTDEDFLCVTEFKGGQSADMSVAIDQIQGGLDLADFLLSGREIAWWRAFIVYRGSMPKQESAVLGKKKVAYKGRKRNARRIDCGSRLLDHLNKPQ